MQTSAHPDDEDNALLAMFSHGQGLRTVLVSATRGDGGQNEIGPELFQALGVLRTEELLAVHRFDGGEQYFTRAVDFGYSFSVEETFEKWGRDEIVGDFVRLIRATRPDVIAGFLCGGEGGGQHHQASTRLTAEAFKAAGDPSRYPEQIEEGLRPWRARRLFCTDFSGFGTAPQKRHRGPADRGHDRVRSGPRPHVCGARPRSTLHAQVPGDVAAPAAARRRLEQDLPPDGFDRRRSWNRARVDVRRHRHDDPGPGALRARSRGDAVAVLESDRRADHGSHCRIRVERACGCGARPGGRARGCSGAASTIEVRQRDFSRRVRSGIQAGAEGSAVPAGARARQRRTARVARVRRSRHPGADGRDCLVREQSGGRADHRQKYHGGAPRIRSSVVRRIRPPRPGLLVQGAAGRPLGDRFLHAVLEAAHGRRPLRFRARRSLRGAVHADALHHDVRADHRRGGHLDRAPGGVPLRPHRRWREADGIAGRPPVCDDGDARDRRRPRRCGGTANG